MAVPAAAKRTAFDVPPHLVDPSGTIAVWYTDPPGTVVQFTRAAAGTVELAEWLVGPAKEALFARFPGPTPLVFVMDLGLMKGRDPAVRPIIVEASKALHARFVRSVVVPPQSASAVYIASLHASVSLLRVFGVPVEIQSLGKALGTLRVAT